MAHDGARRDYELPPTAPFHNEGKTIAGWVMFWVVCVGSAAIGLGMIMSEMWLVIAGVAVLVVGLVLSKVLSAMGMGQPRNRDNPPGPGQADWYA